MHQRYNKLKYYKLYHSIPIGCVLALLLLTVLCISPIGSKGIVSSNGNASAADLTTSSDDISAALIVDDGNIEDVILAESGVNYKSHNIKIKAANVESYTLQISASSNGTSELKLDGGNTTIPGAGGVVGSNMPTNTWGYAWGAENATEDSMTYYTLPAYGSVGTTISTGLLASDTPTNNTIDTSNKLSFAANFSDNIPSGHYTTSVLLSLAVEPRKNTALWDNGVDSDIEYMQEMTPDICNTSSVPTGSQIQLKDSRDEKVYWVGKLKDDNCWMTQNLDLDISAEGLSMSDTDITTSWSSTATYKPISTYKTTNPSGFGTGENSVTSWDPGDKYSTGSTTSQNNGHDHQGNYYTYVAATARTGGGLSNNSSASGSICPKGRRLPIYNGSNKSYNNLLSGLSGSAASGALRAAPYNFIYSGYIDTNTLKDVGANGRYWSSATSNLSIVASGANPASLSPRYFGLSVRCVAR